MATAKLEDFFAEVDLYPRHDPLNPPGILGMTRWGSCLGMPINAKGSSDENRLAIDDLERLEAIQLEIEALNFADQKRHDTLDTAFHRTLYDRHYNRHAFEMWWRHREILGALSRGFQTSLSRRKVAENHSLASEVNVLRGRGRWWWPLRR